MFPWKRLFSCKTTLIFFLKSLSDISFTLIPPISIEPLLTSYKRGIKLTSVDLPDPVPPITPKNSPGLISKLIFNSCNMN